jgi:hypothetical protein
MLVRGLLRASGYAVGSWRDGRSRRDGAGVATESVRGWAKRERLFQPKGEEGQRSPLHGRQRSCGMLDEAARKGSARKGTARKGNEWPVGFALRQSRP